MAYIPPEVVAKAREMDLLTYLRNYEPNELVHFGGSTYCTREQDSLKISNGKWYWFSRGIGGYNALDYLIKVKEMPFLEAVETIMGRSAVQPPIRASTPKKEQPKVLLLPQANRCATNDHPPRRGRVRRQRRHGIMEVHHEENQQTASFYDRDGGIRRPLSVLRRDGLSPVRRPKAERRSL